MKKIRLVFLLVLVSSVFHPFHAKAQAEVIFDSDIIFKDGHGEVFHSISSKTTLAPSGNIVKTADFKLPEDHDLVPEKGKSYIATWIKATDYLGNEVVMIDYNVTIDKSGYFTIKYHSNCAGTIFPRKYKDI
jgi:hypothetical protein